MTVRIQRVEAPGAPPRLEALVDLLLDAVKSGASIGFLWPLSRDEALAYWRGVLDSLDADQCLWVAVSPAGIVGTVQLERCRKPNGRHRAELQKLFVHTRERGKGIAKRLLAAAEAHAIALGCTLLILDTEAGSTAESIYRHEGWRKVGDLPGFALTPDGRLHATAYHYKALTPVPSFELVRPTREHLPGYVAALSSGWSFDNLRGRKAAEQALARIEKDADEFLALQVDREAKGPAIPLADGTTVPRLPGYVYWMWDGEFCGVIGLRWQPGTTALPPYTLGHIGYAVVPWKQRRGYAKRALARMLEHARAEGLEHVEITTDPDNVASQRTIVANGGVLVERFRPPRECGTGEKLRYRVLLKRRLFDVGDVRCIEAVRADIPRVQRFLEENPEYNLAVCGEAPGPRAAQEEFESLPPPDWPLGGKSVLAFESASGEVVAVAEVLRDLFAEGVWHIGLFIVATRLHGSGLADALYGGLESWMRPRGAKWCRLGVVAGNARAERFWERVGYREVRRRLATPMGKRTNDVRVMVKPLAAAGIDEYLSLVARDRPQVDKEIA